MVNCLECFPEEYSAISRRRFVQTVGAVTAAASAAVVAGPPVLAAAAGEPPKPESLVKTLYDSLTPQQKEEICFDWDYVDDRGLLRMHVSNNWQITGMKVASGFFTKDQQEIIEALYWGLYNPDWKDRIKKQLQDDAGGYGKEQSIAIFGTPGSGKFEFVMTGRHLTIRCDGDSVDHVAFGGPIFYGHAAQGFNEKADHPGNVYWHQALKANELYKMLDGKQRKQALIAQAPPEKNVHFQGQSQTLPGLPIAELSADQKSFAQGILATLLEPYRTSDRDEVMRCLQTRGGLDACRLSFYEQPDIGDDKVWDVWRIEGPSFVWHYRGAPHVHVWVNIADSPDVKITTKG